MEVLIYRLLLLMYSELVMVAVVAVVVVMVLGCCCCYLLLGTVGSHRPALGEVAVLRLQNRWWLPAMEARTEKVMARAEGDRAEVRVGAEEEWRRREEG